MSSQPARTPALADIPAPAAEAGTVDIMADEVPEITLDEKLCKRCGICIAVCPEDVYVAGRDGLPIIVGPDRCIWCERCETYCPDYAIQLRGNRGW